MKELIIELERQESNRRLNALTDKTLGLKPNRYDEIMKMKPRADYTELDKVMKALELETIKAYKNE